ncbi:hypothetical protein EOD39_12318 [Acipenser ruthenus]|uniref:Uncharacterized protein n=1 Tax=Acipenser ruthenus TaxID=7906 RepID=A0A662YSD7_ACIRT|nr:hypothetical protein EOD39_12318 [Acipenser ruthenus]
MPKSTKGNFRGPQQGKQAFDPSAKRNGNQLLPVFAALETGIRRSPADIRNSSAGPVNSPGILNGPAKARPTRRNWGTSRRAPPGPAHELRTPAAMLVVIPNKSWDMLN